MLTLNDEADMTFDRISLAVMSSSADNVYPVAVAPGFTSEISYSVSLGVEDGRVVLSPPESIAWLETLRGGRVIWSQNPGDAEERSVVWSNWVPELFEDEVANAEDDNANGLTDEGGLAFDMVGERVNIHLTVERQNPDGQLVPISRFLQVTCRN